MLYNLLNILYTLLIIFAFSLKSSDAWLRRVEGSRNLSRSAAIDAAALRVS
jgi:hypothetical protein